MPPYTEGIIEPYPFCEDIKSFSKTGVGTFLYFFYFKFILLCLCAIFGMHSIPIIFVNKFFSNQMINFCSENSTYNLSQCEKFNNNSTSADWLYQMSYVPIENYNNLFNLTNVESDFMLIIDQNFISLLVIIVLFVIYL